MVKKALWKSYSEYSRSETKTYQSLGNKQCTRIRSQLTHLEEASFRITKGPKCFFSKHIFCPIFLKYGVFSVNLLSKVHDFYQLFVADASLKKINPVCFTTYFGVLKSPMHERIKERFPHNVKVDGRTWNYLLCSAQHILNYHLI